MLYRLLAWCALGGVLLAGGCVLAPTPSEELSGGGNFAPQILTADVINLSSGALRLIVTALDSESDPISFAYEQVEGPLAIERARETTGGIFVADLLPTGEGTHAFRVVASDGELSNSKEVSTLVDVASVAGQDVAEGAMQQPAVPTGEFDICITGEVVADEGLRAFSLDASLSIESLSEARSDHGRNEVLVAVRTAVAPSRSTAPPGAVTLQSEWLGYDVLAVSFADDELVAASPDQADMPSPGAFKTVRSGASELEVACALVIVRFSGDTVTGEIYLLSEPAVAADLPATAEYSAQFTGTRVVQ